MAAMDIVVCSTAANAFLDAFMGSINKQHWSRLRDRLQFTSNITFASWVLAAAENLLQRDLEQCSDASGTVNTPDLQDCQPGENFNGILVKSEPAEKSVQIDRVQQNSIQDEGSEPELEMDLDTSLLEATDKEIDLSMKVCSAVEDSVSKSTSEQSGPSNDIIAIDDDESIASAEEDLVKTYVSNSQDGNQSLPYTLQTWSVSGRRCPVCCEIFDTTFFMRQHVREAHSVVRHAADEDIMARSRQSPANRNSTVPRDIVCRYCMACFTTPANCRTHVREKHSEYIRMYKCIFCSVQSKRLATLHRHCINLHGDSWYQLFKQHSSTQLNNEDGQQQTTSNPALDEPFDAVHIEATSVDDSLLEEIESAITSENGEPCLEIEGYSLRDRKEDHNVTSDKPSNSDDRIKTLSCPVCCRLFLTEGEMRDHLKDRHVIMVPPSHFTMKKRGRKAPLASSTSGHRFRCDECLVGFRSNSSLKAHQREQHSSAVRMYQCHFCPRQVKRLADIGRHYANVHVEEWAVLKDKEDALGALPTNTSDLNDIGLTIVLPTTHINH